MTGKGDDHSMIYLYCLTRSHKERPFDLSMKGIGDRGDQVYSIPFLDLAFVVSDSPKEDYATTRVNVIRHEVICEEVMKEGLTVVPVRFGSVATPTDVTTVEERIVRLIRRKYGELQEILREMEGRDELGLKVYWKKERLFEDILKESPPIRHFRDRLLRTGQATHHQRMELGTMVQEAIEEKRDADARRLALALGLLAERYETNKVLMDLMLLNASFLVQKSQVERFDREVDELDEEYGERMKFNYVGPVPPFDFVELVIHWEEEEEAEFQIVRRGEKAKEIVAECRPKGPLSLKGVAWSGPEGLAPNSPQDGRTRPVSGYDKGVGNVASNTTVEEGEWVQVMCAFCRGTGKNPFSAAKCPACGGRRRVRVKTPYYRCGFCQGSGASSTMTCTVCKGTGAVTAEGEGEVCPACAGRGRDMGSPLRLSCPVCGGEGIVPKLA